MKTIYKYPIHEFGTQTIVMPVGAQILDVQMQNGNPQIWAMVEEPKEVENREFTLVGTGSPIMEEDLTYIATFQVGVFVWHLFEHGSASNR